MDSAVLTLTDCPLEELVVVELLLSTHNPRASGEARLKRAATLLIELCERWFLL
jgi:hypothetical protein